jgi:hypothetical protein
MTDAAPRIKAKAGVCFGASTGLALLWCFGDYTRQCRNRTGVVCLLFCVLSSTAQAQCIFYYWH